ncbi:ABC transporter substrate-binding protein [Alkalicoccus urumqiensis]|uniref:Sugar ABC transporter substrate-binding protein n=1 Tax=Alkalicoccus urumqiensis TaxID=1548213 RepID=A0A2P6MJV6_ALKUR|nr:ABC transporter substrate-binding protein [Alkalicoccus urumqiensis]PRO66572.1 sugar ABC transporter substrate-binding protein [Alkalicoccus urumqiensis]
MIVKKRMSVLAGVSLSSAVLLSACGGNEESGASENGSSNSSSSEDTVTIEIFQGKVEFRDQFLELAERYQEENPDVQIEFSAVGGGSDYFTSLRSRFSSGDEPDVFSLAGPSELEDYVDYVEDLSDMEVTEAALEGTLDGITQDETVYGIPFNQEGYGFIYNKAVFEEAGVDAESIQSYADLEEAVQTLDEQKEELGIEGVFALPGAEAWVMGNHLANVYLQGEFNGDVMEAYESPSVSFEEGDQFQQMLDLQQEYSIQPVLNMDYSQQVEQYFSLGSAAVIQQGDWIYPTLQQMDPEFADNNVGIMSIPLEGEEGKVPVGVPNYWVINKNSDAEVVEASKDFFNWMYTSEEGIEVVQELLNFIPAHENFDPEAIASSLSRDIYEKSLEGETIGWAFLGYPTAWGDDLGAYTQEYMAGEREWQEVEEAAIAEWEERRQ